MPPPRNRILAALDVADWERIAPYLQPAELRRGQVLQRPGEALERVWFPETGVVSLRVNLPTGQAVEVATVGREGLVGYGVVLADTITTIEVVQVPGAALSLPATALQAQLERGGRLRQLVERATQEERPCRWRWWPPVTGCTGPSGGWRAGC